jgi:hypothetical protein
MQITCKADYVKASSNLAEKQTMQHELLYARIVQLNKGDYHHRLEINT